MPQIKKTKATSGVAVTVLDEVGKLNDGYINIWVCTITGANISKRNLCLTTSEAQQVNKQLTKILKDRVEK